MRTNNLFVYLFILLGCYLTINGCNNNPVNNSNTTYKTFSEQEFADFNLRAQDGSLIIIDLEHLNSSPISGSFDTETTGTDVIPIRYDETKEYTFRLDESAEFEMRLLTDPAKEEVFMITPSNPEIAINIPAGDYILFLKSLKNYGTDFGTTQTVFFRPNNSGSDPLEQLLKTGKCDSCEFRYTKFPRLENVSLVDAKIYEGRFSDITSADMNRATLENSYFNNIKLKYLNLANSQIINTSFIQTNFYYVNFGRSRINYCRFNDDYVGPQFDSTVDFSRTTLKNSSFAGGRFTYTNFQDANMSEANFDGSFFVNVDISRTKFYKAHLGGSVFQNAKAFGTDFCGYEGDNVVMRNASIDSETKCFTWPH